MELQYVSTSGVKQLYHLNSSSKHATLGPVYGDPIKGHAELRDWLDDLQSATLIMGLKVIAALVILAGASQPLVDCSLQLLFGR